MPESRPPIDLHGISLADLQKLIDERGCRRRSMNPEHCGHSAMRIARDGTWYHEGAPIRRPRWFGCSPPCSGAARRPPCPRHAR